MWIGVIDDSLNPWFSMRILSKIGFWGIGISGVVGGVS